MTPDVVTCECGDIKGTLEVHSGARGLRKYLRITGDADLTESVKKLCHKCGCWWYYDADEMHRQELLERAMHKPLLTAQPNGVK